MRGCVALLGLLFAACAGLRTEPAGYDFSFVFFNEPNLTRAQPANRPPARAVRGHKPAPVPRQETVAGAAGASGGVGLRMERPTTGGSRGGSGSTDQALSARRAETLATAQRLVGLREAFDADGFLHHILEAGAVDLEGVGARPSIRDVYRALQATRRTYDRNDPAAGDLVFFHNTEDRDGDGRQNDWYSLAGVVESVSADGTITIIVSVSGEVVRRSMSLVQPEVWRASGDGAVVNDILREKRLGDPPYTQYLAGELYAGFAALP